MKSAGEKLLSLKSNIPESYSQGASEIKALFSEVENVNNTEIASGDHAGAFIKVHMAYAKARTAINRGGVSEALALLAGTEPEPEKAVETLEQLKKNIETVQKTLADFVPGPEKEKLKQELALELEKLLKEASSIKTAGAEEIKRLSKMAREIYFRYVLEL